MKGNGSTFNYFKCGPLRSWFYCLNAQQLSGYVTISNSSIDDLFYLFFYFYLYIYPPDSQESDGGAIHRVRNYPDLLPEMPRYCCPLVI